MGQCQSDGNRGYPKTLLGCFGDIYRAWAGMSGWSPGFSRLKPGLQPAISRRGAVYKPDAYPLAGQRRNALFLSLHAHSSLARWASMPILGQKLCGSLSGPGPPSLAGVALQGRNSTNCIRPRLSNLESTQLTHHVEWMCCNCRIRFLDKIIVFEVFWSILATGSAFSNNHSMWSTLQKPREKHSFTLQ